MQQGIKYACTCPQTGVRQAPESGLPAAMQDAMRSPCTAWRGALQVAVVVVGDDCALPGRGAAGRRGIAGTVFVHKARPLTSLSPSAACARTRA